VSIERNYNSETEDLEQKKHQTRSNSIAYMRPAKSINSMGRNSWATAEKPKFKQGIDREAQANWTPKASNLLMKTEGNEKVKPISF